jgi:uncharacterized membrane protein
MKQKRDLKSARGEPESRPPENQPGSSITATAPDPPAKPTEQQLRESLKEAIGSVPDGEQLVERVVSVVRQESFGSPIPHPRYLQAYEDICPGLAKRIVAMAEKAQVQLNEERQRDFIDRIVGMCLGFGALIAFLVSGLYALSLGYSAIGGGLLSAAAIGTVVLTFVNGRKRDD